MHKNKSTTFTVNDFGNKMLDIDKTTKEIESYGKEAEFVNLSTDFVQMGKSTTSISASFLPTVKALHNVIIGYAA